MSRNLCLGYGYAIKLRKGFNKKNNNKGLQRQRYKILL